MTSHGLMITMCAQADRCRLRVLVVEDDEDTALTTAMLIEQAGHAVRVAADGPKALTLAAAEAPDVVLLDLGLPGMDGYSLAGRLRALALPKRPLLVAVTGYGGEVDRTHSHAAGIDLHLVKPVDPRFLVRFLNRFAHVLQPQ